MMVAMFSKKILYFFILLFFILFFIAIAFLYIEKSHQAAEKQFKQHATIIANDIWALNRDGAESYLLLVTQEQHYKFLSVSIPGNTSFLHIKSPRLTGLTYFFNHIKFIDIRNLQEAIVYKGETIGTLQGEQYARVIFPLLNLLVFLLLILVVAVFIIHLFLNRKLLEQQVKERTKNLEESERRFHDLVNLLPEMVVETNLKGTITFANEKARIRLGIDNPEEMQISFFNLMDDTSREAARTFFYLALSNKDTDLEEFTALDTHNDPFPTLVRVAPRIVDGATTGARIIAIDITDRHRMREQLHRDQKMKAIGLMAGGVAHDLNNILSGIVSYPELLLLEIKDDNRFKRPLEMIHKAGLAASEVVADLLTVARGIATNPEIIAPNDLIVQYFDTPDFHQLKSRYPLVTFKSELDANLWNISCSPIHIRKCLMNLIINGVEAITGKGILSITTTNIEITDNVAKDETILANGLYSKICIHDSGSGISPHEIDHIFEPFYTTKVMGRSGTGLGLAVVWNTIQDHGGTVTVESNENGTTFDLYFPSVKKEIAPMIEQEDWKRHKAHGETVLIIDDEPNQRVIATKLLQMLGYSPHTVESGEKALQYLQNHSTDIVVLDMIMAPGMSGRETYSKILEIQPTQKAVIASGFAEDDDVKATIALGASVFIPKPYTLIQLGTALSKTLQA